METVAFVWKNIEVGWSGIVTALSALAAILLLLALRAAQGRALRPMAVLALGSIALSLPLARLIHWYCNPSQYASLTAALTDYASGGLSLTGVFAGTLLAAALGRLLGLYRDPGAVLDCLAPAAALGLGAGRLACRFSALDRSKFSLEGEAFHRLPFMTSSVTASGGVEWRIATFCWESIASFLLCAVLLVLFFTARKRPRARESWRDGNVFWLFLALYGAGEVVLNSTRYDAGYLRSNGFVSLTQICCVAGLLFVCALYSVRSVRARGLRPWHFALWTVFAAAAGGGGYMEYFVQRYGSRFLFAYSVMGSCFLLAAVVVCVLCATTRAGKGRAGDPGEAGKNGVTPQEVIS